MPLITLAEIIQASWALSPAERLQLLDAMWDAEHPDAWPALSPEWLTEVRIRSAAFDADHTNASPWQDVQARVRRTACSDPRAVDRPQARDQDDRAECGRHEAADEARSGKPEQAE